MRDASEISFGILVLGIVLGPLAFLVSFLAVYATTAVFGAEFSMQYVLWPAAFFWIVAMTGVVWRYRRIAAGWPAERRGNSVLHLVEWITLLLSLLFSFVTREEDGGLGVSVKLFLNGLMLMLLLSHALTYALVGYKPRQREILVWGAFVVVLAFQMSRLS